MKDNYNILEIIITIKNLSASQNKIFTIERFLPDMWRRLNWIRRGTVNYFELHIIHSEQSIWLSPLACK